MNTIVQMPNTILFETVIGSHAWRMQHANSDRDVFRCIMVDAREILKGKDCTHSIYNKTDGVDTQISEIGTVIQQLIKGNLNYIVDVNSPIVNFNRLDQSEEMGVLDALGKLRDFSYRGLSKSIYHSFNGMATHNLRGFLREFDNAADVPEYRCNKVSRVLDLGIRLLKGGRIELKPFTGSSVTTIEDQIAEIGVAFMNSKLPETCPITEEMEEWLSFIRILYGDLDTYNEAAILYNF